MLGTASAFDAGVDLQQTSWVMSLPVSRPKSFIATSGGILLKVSRFREHGERAQNQNAGAWCVGISGKKYSRSRVLAHHNLGFPHHPEEGE